MGRGRRGKRGLLTPLPMGKGGRRKYDSGVGMSPLEESDGESVGEDSGFGEEEDSSEVGQIDEMDVEMSVEL